MPFADTGKECIYYVQQGERGLPIMFVHGSAGNHLVWSSQVRALRDLARAQPLAMERPHT